MPECYPIKEDVIYTESVPFQDKDGLKIYKAGVNVFTLLLIEQEIMIEEYQGEYLF